VTDLRLLTEKGNVQQAHMGVMFRFPHTVRLYCHCTEYEDNCSVI